MSIEQIQSRILNMQETIIGLNTEMVRLNHDLQQLRPTQPESDKTATTTNELFTIDELLEYLKISRSTYNKYIRGNIPVSNLGTHPRYQKSDIDKYMIDIRKEMQQVNRKVKTNKKGITL